MNDKSTTKNKYEHFMTPNWAELDDFKAWNPQSDPTIGANFGQQKNDLERSFLGPAGSYQTPELREQQMRAGIQEIGQGQAIATRADQYGQNQQKLGQLGMVAGMKAPKFANTQSETKSRPGLLSIGTQLAGGFLSGWGGGGG